MILRPLLRPLSRPLLHGLTERLDSFNPALLFAGGEQGTWFDPQDLSTMYQDSAGTTPVTAVGQPVGMMLDKRLGAVRGAERLVNGDFSAGTSGWTPANATFSVASGQATITNSGAIEATISQAVITAGTWYEVTGERISATGASGGVNVGGVRIPFTADGAFRYVALAASGGVAIFTNSAVAGHSVVVDNISVKAIPGNHRTQATAASRPTLRQDASGFHYLEYDGVDDSMATGSVDFSTTDKMTVWAGVQRATDLSQCIVEHGTGASAATTSFNLFVPGAARFQAALYDGALASTANGALAAAPQAAVLTMQGDFAAASAATQLILRSNGAAAATGGTLLAAANFGNRVLNFGRRNAASAPLNGREYQTIIRGAATSDSQIARVERFVAARMGVALA